MALQKLQTVNAFVVRDLDGETPALGIVRSAPKILQGGAKELARAQTYQFAALELQYQGASSGVNAAPEARDEAFAAYVEELTAEAGSLMLNPGKGVTSTQLAGLIAADPRSDAHLREVDGASTTEYLTGLGAAACADLAHPLDGASIAIEGFDAIGAAVAKAAVAQGAKVVGISTPAGAAMSADGFDLDALVAAFASDGPAMVSAFADEELPAWKILGAETDILFAGSKMGLIDHKGAPNVKAKVLAPTGSIPYTTKGALMLERQGTTVLPDFVTTAGSVFASLPPDGDTQDALETAVTTTLRSLTSELLGKDASPILEACYRAEDFLKTWRDELPFGRPFA